MSKKDSMSPTAFLLSIFKYSIATLINAFISLISLVVVGRLIAPDIWGPFNIFINTSTLIMNICILGLDQSFIRFFNEPPTPLDKNSLMKACFGISSCFMLLTALVSCIFFPEQILAVFFNNGLDNSYLIFLFLNAFMAMVARYINILYRMEGSISLYTLQSVLMQFFSKLFFLVAVFFGATMESLIFFTLVGMVIFTAVFFFPNHSKLLFSLKAITTRANKDILPYGLALAPTAIMLWCNSLFSSVYISKTLGATATGIFVMVTTVSSIIALVQAGFATFWSAFIYANYLTEQKTIKQVHDYLTALIAGFFCVIVAFDDVIFFVLGPGYSAGQAVFPIMVLVPVFLIISETTVYGISIAKKPIYDTIGIGLSVVTNIVFCYILTPYMGLYGVCLALALSNFIMFLFRTIVAQRFYCSIPNVLRTSVAVILFLLLTFFGTIWWNNFPLKLLASTVIFIMYIILYLPHIKSALELASSTLNSFLNKRS